MSFPKPPVLSNSAKAARELPVVERSPVPEPKPVPQQPLPDLEPEPPVLQEEAVSQEPSQQHDPTSDQIAPPPGFQVNHNSFFPLSFPFF